MRYKTSDSGAGRLPAVLFLLMGMLCVVPSVRADDGPADIERAQTPTTLLDLLPEDDKDWPEPFWMVQEAANADDKANADDAEGGQVYLAWSIKRQGDDIVLRFAHGEKDRHNGIALVYDARGVFKAVEMRVTSPGHTYVNTGIVTGDQLTSQSMTTITHAGEAPRVQRTEPNTVPLDDLFRAKPMHWLPLVVAYHARRGHLGYAFALQIFVHGTNEVLHLDIEDIGTETVEIDGRPRKARMLQIDAWDNPDRLEAVDSRTRVTMSFLPTGECVAVFFKNDQLTAKLRHATRAEVEKAFNLPPETAVQTTETPAE